MFWLVALHLICDLGNWRRWAFSVCGDRFQFNLDLCDELDGRITDTRTAVSSLWPIVVFHFR